MTDIENVLRIHSSLSNLDFEDDDFYNEHQIPPNQKILEEYQVTLCLKFLIEINRFWFCTRFKVKKIRGFGTPNR